MVWKVLGSKLFGKSWPFPPRMIVGGGKTCCVCWRLTAHRWSVVSHDCTARRCLHWRPAWGQARNYRSHAPSSYQYAIVCLSACSSVCLSVLCACMSVCENVCASTGEQCVLRRERKKQKKASFLDCYLIPVHAKGQGIVLCVVLLMNMINVSGEEGFVFSSAMYETIVFCLLPKV